MIIQKSNNCCYLSMTRQPPQTLSQTMFTPTWHLENVRKTAEQYPYTFYVPSEQFLATLEVGDLVKLMFINDLADDRIELEGERMWVEITHINGNDFVGSLANNPYQMYQLTVGDIIHFQRQHIMTYHGDKQDPVPSVANDYWDRCMTTKAILDGEAKIGFICRTEPLEQTDSNGYHDTGWQILSGDETDAYFENADNGQFVALGVLLNMDDSFIHLLDSEVGSAFIKNEQGEWVVDETFTLEDE